MGLIKGPLENIGRSNRNVNFEMEVSNELKNINEESMIIITTDPGKTSGEIEIKVDISEELGLSTFRNLTYLCDTSRTKFLEDSFVELVIPFVDDIDKDILLISIMSRINMDIIIPPSTLRGEYRNLTGSGHGDSIIIFDFDTADFWLMVEPPIRKLLSTVISRNIVTFSSCGGHPQEGILPYIIIDDNKFNKRFIDFIKGDSKYIVEPDELDRAKVIFKDIYEDEDSYINDILRYL